MISLDLMRQYVHAADELADAKVSFREAEERLERARRTMEKLEPKMGDLAPKRAAAEVQAGRRGPKVFESDITDEELMQRSRAKNKKIRGEATMAIMKAMPGTLSQITDRTGLKKTTVSTLLSRLQHDELIKKSGEEVIPGYEKRAVAVYDLAV